MKSLLGLVIYCCISIGPIAAQGTEKLKMDEIDVKDSGGMAYPTAIWQKLVMTGKYGLRLLPGAKNALLTKLSPDEITARAMKLPKPRESNFFTTGAKIASFSEKDMNGNRFNLKELAGKVVVLNFWFINCGPCRREMPELNELVESVRNNKDVVFIAVSLDEKSEIQDFLKANPFSYNIIDNGRYIASKYNVNLYPTHVILDKQGKVVFHTSGYAMNTVEWVKKAINSALSEMPL